MKAAWRTAAAWVFVTLLVIGSRAAEVTGSEIKGTDFIGDFYCRDHSNHNLGIVLLGGSEGGKPRGYLAEFLATNGYPTLALAYFREKGLPESLQSIPLEYFEKPIRWMETNRAARVNRIVVIGASRGAELALLLGSVNRRIKGVIALSPSSVVWNGMPKELPIVRCSTWTFRGEPVPFMPYDPARPAPQDLHDVYIFFQDALKQKDVVAKAAIAVERIGGPVLLASGQDDPVWPAGDMADAICSRLKEKKFKCRCLNLKYSGAGHTLDERWMLGGTAEGNQKARLDFDKQALDFLRTIE